MHNVIIWQLKNKQAINWIDSNRSGNPAVSRTVLLAGLAIQLHHIAKYDNCLRTSSTLVRWTSAAKDKEIRALPVTGDSVDGGGKKINPTAVAVLVYWALPVSEATERLDSPRRTPLLITITTLNDFFATIPTKISPPPFIPGYNSQIPNSSEKHPRIIALVSSLQEICKP